MNNQNLTERIAETQELLRSLNKQAKELELEKLRKKYGQDVTCKNCRYGCVTECGDFHSTCIQGMYLYSSGPCKRFKPHNILSKYLLDNGWSYSHFDGLEMLFADILDDDESLIDAECYHPVAIGILELREDI